MTKNLNPDAEQLDPDPRGNQCGSTTMLATNLKCHEPLHSTNCENFVHTYCTLVTFLKSQLCFFTTGINVPVHHLHSFRENLIGEILRGYKDDLLMLVFARIEWAVKILFL
jgi:hypothetical protein